MFSKTIILYKQSVLPYLPTPEGAVERSDGGRRAGGPQVESEEGTPGGETAVLPGRLRDKGRRHGGDGQDKAVHLHAQPGRTQHIPELLREP